jgi:hypothetical protein
MLHIAKKTRLNREEIINRASKYFGKNGEGLTETCRNLCSISFEGIGGYLSTSVTDESRFRMVDVETREFEYQAKRFLERI